MKIFEEFYDQNKETRISKHVYIPYYLLSHDNYIIIVDFQIFLNNQFSMNACKTRL